MNPSHVSGENRTAKIWAIVPAAGIGSRMASDRPKQYLSLLGKSVIEHSLHPLLSHPSITSVYVPLAEHDHYWSSLTIASHPKIKKVKGGKERADSVLNGLLAMAEHAAENDWVLVHDAARPCLHSSSLEKLIIELKSELVGGILANPVHDTIKKVSAHNFIEETVDRRVLWQAQTPQMFRYSLLRNCLAQALSSGGQITDEASAIEWAGHQAKVVAGPGDNIKITRPEDLALAEFILARQK